MLFKSSSGEPRQLLLAWSVYWATIASVKLGPGVAAIWRVTRPGREHGSVSATLDNDLLRVIVTSGPDRVWEGAAALGTLALWIAGPPLLFWLAWLLLARPRGRLGPRADPTVAPTVVPNVATDGVTPPVGALNRPAAEGFASGRSGREAVSELRDRAR